MRVKARVKTYMDTNKITKFRNVRLSVVDLGIAIVPQQRPKSIADIYAVANFNNLEVVEEKDLVRVNGDQDVFGFVPLVDFDTKKYSKEEVKQLLGIKYVSRGAHKLSHKQPKNFIFSKPFRVLTAN